MPALRRPPATDVALAGILLLAALVEAAFTDTTQPPAMHALVSTVVVAALAFRRQFPLVVLAIALAGMVALDPNGEIAAFAAVVISAYTTGTELEGRRSLAGLALAVGPLWLAFVLDEGGPSDFVAAGVLYGGSWAVGRLVRQRGRHANALAERAARLEREQGEQRAVAVAEERARIARELHDIVSHSISVITLQAQAVRRRLGPEHEREVAELQQLETTARQAMAEMRRLFGVLRSDGERPPLAPQPGLGQLPRLLERSRAAGLPVETRIDGKQVPLPPGIDLAAYRVVQEALTNALKHAGPAAATVRIRYGERDLELIVEDDGSGPTANGSGHGLIGMRERISLYGGTLEIGANSGRGYRVRATLPLRDGDGS